MKPEPRRDRPRTRSRAAPNRAEQRVQQPPFTAAQKLVLLAILALAAGLRLEGLATLSLSHFDEGVYVSSAFLARGAGPLALHPMQPLYSPPLYPWMIAAAGASMGGYWPAVGAAVSALIGLLTVLLMLALARRIEGNWFGLVAAGLLAISDFHIAFSRMALTDAAVTFWFVLAFYCAVRVGEELGWVEPAPSGLQNGRTIFGAGTPADWRRLALWTIALGLASGAAWNTKYNGWMPIAIAAAAMAVFWLRPRWAGAPAEIRRPSPVPGLLCLAGAATLTLCCFWPWWSHVESTFAGGYDAVRANHRSYFMGPGAWPANLWRLATSLPALRHYGWIVSLVALIAAIACAVSFRRGSSTRQRMLLLAAGVAILAPALRTGMDGIVFLVAAAGIVPACLYGRWSDVLLAAWVGSFLVLAPLYHPYLRLLLPALPGAILLALGTLWPLRERLFEPQKPPSLPPPALAVARAPLAGRRENTIRWSLLAAALGIAWWVAFIGSPFGWLPARGLWQRWTTRQSYLAYGELVTKLVPADGIVLCQGHPALTVYGTARQLLPVQRLAFTELLEDAPPGRPCYLAIDFLVFQLPPGPALHAIVGNSNLLEPLAAAENDLNVVTLLDWLTPQQVARKLSAAPRAEHRAPVAAIPLPPALDAMSQDTIALYRIRREETGKDR